MKAYKGFNEDMTCRGFQYEEGKEYKTDKVKVCESGFHACEHPLDCFSYYRPTTSVYHEVEIEGKIDKSDEDSKVASSNIKIGARLTIAGLVKAALDFTFSRTKKESESDQDYGASSVTGNYGASSATGNCGASSATGYKGASSATGYKGASSATGYKGASSATGDYGASSATGNCGASSATGDYGASSATGNCGASSATGYKGASSATGDYGASSATGNCGASSATGYKCKAEANDPCAVAVAWGYKGRAKGVKGSYIVLAEWVGDENYFDAPDKWELKRAKLIHIDGKKYKENTFYELVDGKIIESDETND